MIKNTDLKVIPDSQHDLQHLLSGPCCGFIQQLFNTSETPAYTPKHVCKHLSPQV